MHKGYMHKTWLVGAPDVSLWFSWHHHPSSKQTPRCWQGTCCLVSVVSELVLAKPSWLGQTRTIQHVPLPDVKPWTYHCPPSCINIDQTWSIYSHDERMNIYIYIYILRYTPILITLNVLWNQSQMIRHETFVTWFPSLLNIGNHQGTLDTTCLTHKTNDLTWFKTNGRVFHAHLGTWNHSNIL